MSDSTYFSYQEALDQFVVASQDPQGGVGTGYSIDGECGLMSTGELALLWARSGAGKSALLLNILANTPDVPTVFFNMEMRARTLAEWLLTMTGDIGVHQTVLKEIILSGEADPRFPAALAAIERSKLVIPPSVWFVEPRSPDVDELARVVDDITNDTGIRPVRVMIDHLQLMRGARDYEGTVTLGEQLHQWAQDDGLSVIAAQQTGRGGNAAGERNDGHLPVTLSSGLFGGEHDADWLWGLWRPERNPMFRKSRAEFKTEDAYLEMRAELSRVRNMAHLAVVKNRPNGTLNEDGITLFWEHSNRKLEEY